MSDAKTSRPVVLITGGGTGVGRACALQFAERGYDVVINYSRSQADAERTLAEVQARGAVAIAHRCDVSNDAEVRAMIETIEARFGRLDVLVNNAATTEFIAHPDLDAMTEAMWDRILAVNTKGLSSAFAPQPNYWPSAVTEPWLTSVRLQGKLVLGPRSPTARAKELSTR